MHHRRSARQASELTGATHSGGGNEAYSFDHNGNRTNTGYSAGTNNQLSSDGTNNYTFDASGNMTKKTTISTSAYVTYTWDYHNRLTDVQAYNSSNALQSHEHYTYDVFNRLIERQVDASGGGTYTTTQAFVYGGSNAILVYNGSGTLTDRLLNGPGANNALADENGSGTVSWFLKDREGTTNDVIQYNSGTNTTTVVDHLIYNAFGKITSQTNSAYQPLFAYTGQMWDTAAGLYYYHARWYDASTGRFISQDPTGFAAGDANLYRYVSNSPTNGFDPFGLWTFTVGIGVDSWVFPFHVGFGPAISVGYSGAGGLTFGAAINVSPGGCIGFGASPGVNVTATNAPTVGTILGFGSEIGVITPVGGAAHVAGTGYTGLQYNTPSAAIAL